MKFRIVAGTTLVTLSAITATMAQASETTAADTRSGLQGSFLPIGRLATDPATLEALATVAFGVEVTNKVVQPLEGAAGDCRAAGAAYEASCLAAAFKKAATRTGGRPDYRDAEKALRAAARALDKLARANADPEAPRKRGRNGRYIAVKPDAVAAVRKEALRIVQETETKLLRSSGSGTRKVHYQRIAAAVGSTKVILRS